MKTKIYQGLDVSEHNGVIDWEKVRAAGYDFAILRCSSGKSRMDKRWAENYTGARAAGLKIGVYHYSYALTPADAQVEAALVRSLTAGKDIPLGVWFDMEDADDYKTKHGLKLTRANLTPICAAFVKACPGAGIYTALSWLGSIVDVAACGNPPIWCAQWNRQCDYTGDYIMWQYSSKGRVPGITGDVDLDQYYGLWPEEVKEMTKEDVQKLIEEAKAEAKRETIEAVKALLIGADTQPSDWARAEMGAAIADGITDGTRPLGYCTRQEVAIMCERTLDLAGLCRIEDLDDGK